MSILKTTEEERDHAIDLYRRGLLNPWLVRDGEWGGMGGDQLWVRAERYGFAKGDVIERAFVKSDRSDYRAYEWRRIWVDSEQAWRELTAGEIERIEQTPRATR